MKRDKLFSFVNYEGLRQVLNLSQDSFVPSLNALSGILSAGNVTVDTQAARFLNVFYPLPDATGPSADVGAFVFPRAQDSTENYFIARIDEATSMPKKLGGSPKSNEGGILRPRAEPKALFCDYGSEFINQSVDLWAYRNRVRIDSRFLGSRPTMLCRIVRWHIAN